MYGVITFVHEHFVISGVNNLNYKIKLPTYCKYHNIVK